MNSFKRRPSTCAAFSFFFKNKIQKKKRREMSQFSPFYNLLSFQISLLLLSTFLFLFLSFIYLFFVVLK